MQNNFMMNNMMRMNPNQQEQQVVTGFATSDANRSFIAAQNDNTNNGRGNVAEVTVLDGDQQLKPPVGEDSKSKKSADTSSPLN
jgi:hypothetical protein